MPFKLVVSDPKTRKSYQKEVGSEGLLGKKTGDKIDGKIAGLDGYELLITGGSDKDGFPMRPDVEGTARKKILISGPPGFHPGTPGVRKRKSVRGNTISEDIVQVNTKVVKYGKRELTQLFAAKPAEMKGKEGEKEEEKPAEHTGKEEKPAEKEAEAEEEAGKEEDTGPGKQDEAEEPAQQEKQAEAESAESEASAEEEHEEKDQGDESGAGETGEEQAEPAGEPGEDKAQEGPEAGKDAEKGKEEA